ncbi:MAG: D-alanyl-D-alanine carboxypeptidase family protein [Methyloligellaceae bacterium]
MATLSVFATCIYWTGQSQAQPAIVFNAKNGYVISADDPDRQWYPASLTKLMTVYLTFEALSQSKISLKSKIKCSKRAHRQPPSRIGVPVGGRLSVEQALKSVIVKSANDVTVMLAEHIAGSEKAFVKKMNLTAQGLNMTRTNFTNTNGLPDKKQVTTARDMALLSHALLKDFPKYAHFFATKKAKIGKRTYRNHNTLLRSLRGSNGMKTGFICDSGFNIVASAKRNNMQLIAVVFGGATAGERNRRAAKLLENGFYSYFWKSLLGMKSLEKLPLDKKNINRARSIRKQVRVRSCGYRGPKKPVKKKSAALDALETGVL